MKTSNLAAGVYLIYRQTGNLEERIFRYKPSADNWDGRGYEHAVKESNQKIIPMLATETI